MRSSSKQEVEVKIRLLKGSLKHIKIGMPSGICHALTKAYRDLGSDYQSGRIKSRLCGYIAMSLQGHIFLDSWLMRHRPNLQITKASLVQHRRDWVLWMIKCLEKDLEKFKK